MSLTAALSESNLSAAPGEDVSLQVTVRNTGSVVDEFTLEVEGEAGAWATIEPTSLSLFPDDDGVAVVTFHLPRSVEVSSGDVPFAVNVRSREDPDGVMVEEGMLLLGGFIDVSAELMPNTARAFRQARYEVSLDNMGNTEVVTTPQGSDPDGVLAFHFDPPQISSQPGSATFSVLLVRPRRPILRGQPKTRTFQVSLPIEGQEPIVLDGTIVQQPLFRRGIFAILAVLLALFLVLALLWFAFLKPRVQSTARAAVAKPLAQTNAAVNDIGSKVGPNPTLPTNAEAIQAEAAGNTAAPSGGGATETTLKPAVPAGSGAASISTQFGNPTDRRLLATGTGTVTDGFTVDAGKVFSLTDLMFQNPAGDSGTLTLSRGKDVLFADSLANFRDVDYHFVAPIVFDEKTDVTLQVECANSGGRPCSVGAYLVGFVKNKS
jgi:hypothetical protein